MNIIIRNKAELPNKYLRFIKWKMIKIQKKFQQLIYVEVFLKTEGNSPKEYSANIRLGVPGNDIIIQNKSNDLGEIFKKSFDAIHRNLAKYKNLKNKS